jgi:alpha-tubulin suppressor-like RCC1 family protein
VPLEGVRIESLPVGGPSANHTCAVSNTSGLYCWGDNSHGQVGRDPLVAPMVASPAFVE